MLSDADLEQITGGFNPVKYGKYVINEFVKVFVKLVGSRSQLNKE